MKLWDKLGGILRAPFERSSSVQDQPSLEGPEAVIWPGQDADVSRHVAFLIDAKDYITNHEVPEEFQGRNNQYSHAGRPAVYPDDLSRPAITNGCYVFFEKDLASIGFPLFIKEAVLFKDGEVNPAFCAPTLWESLTAVMGRYGVAPDKDKDGDTKFGYHSPLNHRYVEVPMYSKERLAGASEVIEFYSRTEARSIEDFLSELDQKMAEKGYGVISERAQTLEANA